MEKEHQQVVEAERIKRILSYQRHEWLNDVQVLMGYLSLKKYDRMKTYFGDIIEKANKERLFYNFQYAPLVVMLLTLPYCYAQYQVTVVRSPELTIHDERNIVHMLEFLLPWFEEQIRTLLMDEQLTMIITKKEKIIVSLQVAENINDDFIRNDLNAIREAIKKWNGEIHWVAPQIEMNI